MAYTTIDKPDEYFNTVLYTGNGGTLAVSGVNFQPDFVWLKNIGATAHHNLYNVVTGATKYVQSSTDLYEQTSSTGLTAFSSDGFSLGSDSVTNTSSNNYVSWNWKAGGSASSNSNGSITSSVSVNTAAGFSVVSYTGVGAARTIGHGLGATPTAILVKNRNYSTTGGGHGRDWVTWHSGLAANQNLRLNGTAAAATDAVVWNNTLPTSSVFSVGNQLSSGQAYNYIAYCFTDIKGYSKCSTYTGNGSDNGPFVWTGFKPAFLMIKSISAGGTYYNWGMWDNKRSPLNVNNKILAANRNDDESDASNLGTDRNVDFLSNGFKQRRGISENYNASGVSYMYMAFAENPFVTSEGVPATAR